MITVMDPRHAILFEPIAIGPKVLPNRFYQVPHCTSFGVVRPRAQAAFRGMKAEGGWGAVCTEECSIHPEADQMPMVLARLWDDDDAANLSLMSDSVHENGALAGIELWYGGVHGLSMESRAVQRAPSQIASDALPMSPCREMDLDDIKAVQGFYVDAALRSRDAGFDIICIYGGHEGLLEQFLSPYYNKRTDGYGGSLANRTRMWREVVEAISTAVGSDCAVSVRLSADSMRGEEGVLLERDVLPFVEMCDDVVDLWDVHIGGVDWGDDATPSRFFKSGRAMDWVKSVKDATRKPVVAVGRFTDPNEMARVINDGVLDIIGAARPSIADPFLPAKIREGRLEDIRECIGCNICVSRFEHGGPPIVCTQNATSGEEYRRGWHPERFSKAANAENDVLIVGAGPAGMECARVLGERGMRNVHLVDADAELGGHLKWMANLPGLREWSRVIDYRLTQFDKLDNVTVIPNTRMSPQDIVDYGAGLVVIASGSHWSGHGLGPVTREGIPGADAQLPYVLTPEQIMVENKPVPGERVVIIEAEGYNVGAALADRLSAAGKAVTVLTHLGELAPYTHYTLEATHLRRKLYAQGVTVAASMIPTRIAPEGVWAHYAYADSDDAKLIEADAVVLVTQRVSDTTLYRGIVDGFGADKLSAEGITGVYRIGDCVAPRIVAESVFDGHRLAREIDSADPSMPLPYLRERPIARELPILSVQRP
ncbi:FAD-dependent oxidoreductase [Mycolicibacterium diernhoferi]|uniref:Dimethylamine dehydrogenase n=2 Tax=Mycolicibacterium diernhoferi TaxID=1801 RepID=A0A2A7NZG2_9MYCO|nr:dimethylamine dehydrogenase [Mycolicibacterium diernhoferi]QYL24305.1 FAD-dependent oxidoreductase [Mycolicibacterium diernhoferi]